MKALQKLRAAGKNTLSSGIAALLLLTAGAASTAKAANPYPDSSYLYKQYNNAMNYRLFVPPTYVTNGTQQHPLVIFVHGNGEFDSGFVAGNPNVCNSAQMGDNGQFEFVTTTNQATFPCFFALVQKTNPGTMTLPNAIAGMIDQIASQYRIDADRVVVTGLSGGGAEVLQMAQYYKSKLAAIVPICSVVPNGFALPNGPTPAWFFHGSGDTTVSPYSTFVNSRKFSEVGGTPIFTMYNTTDHWIWGRAFVTPQLIPWIAAQRRGVASTNDPARVTITTPGTNPATVGTSSLTVSGGTATQSGIDPQLSSVRHMTTSVSYNWLYNNVAASGGPASWSTASMPLNAAGTNSIIEVVALGNNSFSTYYTGTTFYTKVLNATYQPGGGDATAPVVTITTPTSSTTYTQTATTINLGGTASDNVGVTQVQVYNDRTAATTMATGTTSWSVGNLALLSGANVLTVTARDAANNTSTDVLTVTVNTTPPPATGWTGVNIDSTGGSYTYNSGTFSISGTGEVWGAKSGMYYVYKQADGNCSITSKVTSTQATNWGFGKGGVMIRDGLTASSNHVFMALMNSNGSVFYSNNAGLGTSSGTGVPPYWVRLTRVGNLFTGQVAPDVSGAPGTWITVGTRTLTMSSSVYVGMGSSSNDTSYNTSTFTNTSTTGTPEEWQSLDIGTTGGSASISGDVFTVAGKGVLWGGSDKVRYVYQNASGDCSITARVTAVQSTNWGYGRAGVMIRETTTVGAPYVYHGITGSVGSALHSSNAGASVTYGTGTAPYWVRLTRAGSLFTAEVAPNVSGAPGTWTTVGTRTMTMGTSVLIGLGVFSNDDAVVNTSTIDGVSVAP